ncbi:MAG TPA: hypothetical protein VGH89_36650 [Pseudonocardia sp.]|jgi:hypothetical protein
MQIVNTVELPWQLIVPNTRGGDIFRKVIRSAEGGRHVSYDVRIERFGEGDRGYESIRHRHDFEQLRFAVSGSMDLGFATLNEGDIGYFPANAYYGPQKCAGAIILIAQWGDRFIAKSDSDRAVAELADIGEFREGFYTSVDDAGNVIKKDPLNAIWEHVFGQPYVPQAPRYPQPILVTPAAFDWADLDDGVRARHLGVFTENALSLAMVSWDKDAQLRTQRDTSDSRPTFLFTTAGAFRVHDVEFGPLTGIWSEPGEDIAITAAAGSELMMVRFPEPSSRITLGLEN